VEWLKAKALSSSPSIEKKKINVWILTVSWPKFFQTRENPGQKSFDEMHQMVNKGGLYNPGLIPEDSYSWAYASIFKN
jgi:hypothetical protein